MTTAATTAAPLHTPMAFIWRRLHSLAGLWLVLFLIEHLLVNSQAALLLGENGGKFVEMVNSIHNLPFLPVIELTFLGVPILIHGIWGIQYLRTSKMNALPYERNHAYNWQRITSWILLVGLLGHVYKFRFLDYPEQLNFGKKSFYFIWLKIDNGLYTVAERLGATLYDVKAVDTECTKLEERNEEKLLLEAAKSLNEESSHYDPQRAIIFTNAQSYQEKCAWIEKLSSRTLKDDDVVAVAPDFGTASLLAVRDTFKSPIYASLYTLFVLAACFHGLNGLWTALITWGVILRMKSQKQMRLICYIFMSLVTFLGVAAIWGTYFLNLRT